MDNRDKKHLTELVEDYWIDNVLHELTNVLREKANVWSDLELHDSSKQCTVWAEEIDQLLERMKKLHKSLRPL